MAQDTTQDRLHYSTPATSWDQALPLGNGRLGCMVHGRTTTELLQLNEDSVWYGGPQDRTPHSAKHLPKLRQLIRGGQHTAAERLARDHFFSSPSSMRHSEPLGTCYLDLGEWGKKRANNTYRRWLDISRAVNSVEYEVVDTREALTGEVSSSLVKFRRDVIASYPDNVILVRIITGEPIQFTVSLNRRGEKEWDTNEFLDSLRAEAETDIRDGSTRAGTIVMHATPGGRDSNRLCCVIGARCAPGGTIEATNSGSLVINARECLLAIGAHTTYRHADPENAALADVSAALRRSWDELLARHVADYRSLYDRTNLRLWPDASSVPTDTRLARRDPQDAGLAALYHNYGRYLLISSSRGAANNSKSLPANLQGIWNPSFTPPWGSKYTININIQMNYWPAAPCNLPECATPLVDLLERMAQRGRKTARLMYGCGGWCAHHNTDIWADTDPADQWMPSTLWPLGGAWLCVDAVQMLQYRFDQGTLERLFPVLEGCVEFLRDFLIPSADGRHLVASPSLSPENTFVSESGELGIFCEGSAMDMSIIKSVFGMYLWSVDTLRYTSPLKQQVEEMIALLPELQINGDGLIQEWGLHDYKEHEPGHRHVSHLYALYPGASISPMSSLALAEAAKRVLERRAAHGGGHTGWSRAWLLNMHARLLDAEGCANHMELLLTKSTLPNLLDNHPPFQIDGNFGGCAGILECLVQSTEVHRFPFRGVYLIAIKLLPACPKGWAKGRLEGVCVRGGWKVSFEWDEGRIIDPVRVQATQEDMPRAQVVYPDGEAVHIEGVGEHMVRRQGGSW